MVPKSSSDKSSVNSEPSNKTVRKLEVVQEALREIEEKCQAIINNIEDGYYEVDLDGNFTYFNDAMALITGYSRQELIGMNNRQIMDEYHTRQVSDVFIKVYHTGLAAKAIDWELIRKDGLRCIVEVSVSLKKDLNSQPVGFLGIARDITDRRRYVETLEAREKELQIKSRNLEEVNTTLKVLLERRDADKAAMEDTIIGNINDLVIPYLERVKKRTSDKKSREYLSVLEHNLDTITSSFFRRLTTKYANLTSTEIEVANLVKNGKSIKEIADLLCISGKTAEVHRMSIRKKMGIANTKTSLRSHLLSLG